MSEQHGLMPYTIATVAGLTVGDPFVRTAATDDASAAGDAGDDEATPSNGAQQRGGWTALAVGDADRRT